MHPQMLGYGGEAKFPSWDVTRVFWADLAFAARALAGGELPLWNPYDRAGYSFVAEPQSGLFDPVTWFLVLLALLIGSAPAWLITLKSVIYFGIAASGMDAYLRERKLPPWAVGLGTVVFVLCPRLDKLKDQSALWPTAWAGWLMLAAHRCFEDPSPRRGVWLGLAVAVTVLSGYPPMVFRLGLLLAPLVALILWRRVRAEQDQRAYLKRLGRALGLASLIVVGLCAAQVQATLSVLPSTERAALSLGEVFATRVAPRHALGILGVVPETSALMIYGGLASSIGIALALVFRRGTDVALLFVLGAFGFMLACGHRLPVLPALAELPGFRSFRIPAHYLVLTSVATAVLAAVGIGNLARLERRRLAPVAGVAALGLTAALLVTPELTGTQVLVSGAVVASIVGILAWDGKGRAIAGWSLVGLTAVQMFIAGRPIAELLRPHPSPDREQLLLGFMGDPEVYRVADFEWAKNRMGPRLGVRDLLGHRPALTDRRYRMLYERATKSPHLLRAMNVELAAFRKRERATRSRFANWHRPHRYVFEYEEPWPLAFWASGVRITEGPKQVLEELERGAPPAVWVEREDLPDVVSSLAIDSEAELVAPALVEYSANRVIFEVDAPGSGVLVVNESYDPGWFATVDGEPAPVFRANMIHRALPVGPGRHVVELRYAPPGLGWLLLLFAATFFGAAAFLARERLATRRVAATRREADAEPKSPPDSGSASSDQPQI